MDTHPHPGGVKGLRAWNWKEMVVSLDWEKRFGRSGEAQCPRVGTELEKDGRNIGRKEMQPAKQNRREKEEGNARRRERKITQSLLLRPQGKGREQIPQASKLAYPSRPPFGFGGESFRVPARCFRDLSQSTATHIHHTQIIMVVK